MKTIFKYFAVIILAAVMFISWKGYEFFDGSVAQELTEYKGKNNVLRISPNNNYNKIILTFDLSQYNGQTVEIAVSSQIWLDTPAKVIWQLNNSDWTTVAGDWGKPLNAGQWLTVQGTQKITLSRSAGQSKNFLYLPSEPINNVSFYIADFTVTINGKVINNQVITVDNNIPALYTKWSFPVGAGIPYEALLSSNPQNGLLRHFNKLAPENLLKPDFIMPKPWTPTGAYRWAVADQFVNYAEANSKRIHGHVLCWHQATPVDFFRGSGIEGRATIDELYARMEHHIKTVFEKYKGRIEWWDVVNEAVGDDGNPRPGVGLKAGFNQDMGTITTSFFTQIMEDAGKKGMDRYEWIVKAFQFARKYADLNGGQNVKLNLNEWDIENKGIRQTGFLRLLDYLTANNVPIDGVGIQSHVYFDDFNVKNLGNTIDTIAAKKNRGKNLVVLITELDITLFRKNEMTIAELSERDYKTRLAKQTSLYREAFDMFEQKYKQGKLVSVTLWGISDGESGLNSIRVSDRVDYPLLFDRNYQAKPAYYELIKGR